jgi:hypothetical protein
LYNKIKKKILKKLRKERIFCKKKNQRKISIEQCFEYKKIKGFSKTQVLRYGFYRQSDLKREKVKKIAVDINPFLKNINSSDPLFVCMKGLAKLFIGELVEISKQIMFEKNDTVEWYENPLHFSHLFEGVKRYFSKN